MKISSVYALRLQLLLSVEKLLRVSPVREREGHQSGPVRPLNTHTHTLTTDCPQAVCVHYQTQTGIQQAGGADLSTLPTVISCCLCVATSRSELPNVAMHLLVMCLKVQFAIFIGAILYFFYSFWMNPGHQKKKYTFRTLENFFHCDI